MLDSLLESLAANLDRLAEHLCEVPAAGRLTALTRLARISADMEALIEDLARQGQRGPPAATR
jgi:hypothetical protein